MSQPRHKLYGELAWLWPLLSPPEDYAVEAQGVRRLITRHLKQAAKADPSAPRYNVLELGSGGGHLMAHLTPQFNMTAVDLAPAMLKLSRRLNPGVPHHRGDMRTIRLDAAFDVVLIHDALGYMATPADLSAALRSAAAHLKPNGLLVLLPDELRETFTNHQSATQVATTDDGRQVTLVSHAQADDDGQRYTLTMLFLIHTAGQLHIEADRHRCGLFSRSQWRAMLNDAGFEHIRCRLQTPWRQGPCLTARRAMAKA